MALSGLMYVTGDPDREPLCTGGEPAEYFGALNAWIATLAALEHREQTGEGQHIDVSLLESLGSADEYNSSAYSYMGAVRRRFYSRHHLPSYPSDIFPCRDGHIAVIAGAGGLPSRLAILLEQPELESNPLFGLDIWARVVNWRDFEALIVPYLMQHGWRDLLTRAQELRMPFAPVLDAQGLLENEHLQARGFFQPVEQPGLGTLRIPGHPFGMSETPALPPGPAPGLGQHTGEVLRALGYEPDDAVILRERGVT